MPILAYDRSWEISRGRGKCRIRLMSESVRPEMISLTACESAEEAYVRPETISLKKHDPRAYMCICGKAPVIERNVLSRYNENETH